MALLIRGDVLPLGHPTPYPLGAKVRSLLGHQMTECLAMHYSLAHHRDNLPIYFPVPLSLTELMSPLYLAIECSCARLALRRGLDH